MSEIVQIDGSFGEGGGQILRSSLSLSVVTGKPFEVFNIRAGREKPGLRPQHLAAVRAAVALCGAELRGDAVGSVHLTFAPLHEARPDEYSFDIGTAGASTLVAQTVILPLSLLSSSSRVEITGGTHNPMAPTADYLEQVYAATLREHGWQISTRYGPPGFYPRGGGRLEVIIGPAEPAGFSLGSPVQAEPASWVVTSSLPPSVANRAEAVISRSLSGAVMKRVESGPSTGAAVTICMPHAGFSALGERGKPMERVAQEAVDLVSRWKAGGAAIDEHLADQLVLPAIFAPKPSRWRADRITEHLRSAIWVAHHFAEFESSLDESTNQVTISPAEDPRKQ